MNVVCSVETEDQEEGVGDNEEHDQGMSRHVQMSGGSQHHQQPRIQGKGAGLPGHSVFNFQRIQWKVFRESVRICLCIREHKTV